MTNPYQSPENEGEIVLKPFKPSVMVWIGVVIVSFVGIAVVPEFVEIFDKLEVKLPNITLIVISTAWWICSDAVLLLVYLLSKYLKKPIAYVYLLTLIVFIQFLILH